MLKIDSQKFNTSLHDLTKLITLFHDLKIHKLANKIEKIREDLISSIENGGKK